MITPEKFAWDRCNNEHGFDISECYECKCLAEAFRKAVAEYVAEVEKRVHDKCAVRIGGTYAYLADGTIATIKRDPDVKGRVWLEVNPQNIVRTQKKGSDPAKSAEAEEALKESLREILDGYFDGIGNCAIGEVQAVIDEVRKPPKE